MTSKINIIKNHKLIMRDYLGLINEINFAIESKIENLNAMVNDSNDDEEILNYNNTINNFNNKINKFKEYKVIIKEYMHHNYTNTFNDADLDVIFYDGIELLPEDIIDCYPSIFEFNIYMDVLKNLNEISSDLLHRHFISNEIYDYIKDTLTHENNFKQWKILFAHCFYILCDSITKRNNNQFIIPYISIEDFENAVDIETTPMNQWPFHDFEDEYIDYVEILYSYFNIPSNNRRSVQLIDSSDDEDDDNENNITHTLNDKYSLITNNDTVECNICFQNINDNYRKCNRCIFQMCLTCYNKYNKNHCPMCKN